MKYIEKRQKYIGIHIFAASMTDINKTLEIKKFVDPAFLLSSQYHHYLSLFDPKEITDLSLLHRYNIDHRIELIKENDKKIDSF